MKYYLSELLPRLKKYSASLDQTAFLVDKPWVVSNGSSQFEKMIFRRDGRVHLSSDGKVQDGHWEYLSEAQSLLIDYGSTKVLYRHQYLDESVLALKRDGSKSKDDYFLLANENVIPDCNAELYLRNKYLSENNIEIKKLDDGKAIEVRKQGGFPHKEALMNGRPIKDGHYLMEGRKQKIAIRDGRLIKTFEKFDYPNGLILWQQSGRSPMKGDLAEGAEDGKLNVKIYNEKYTLAIKNGKVRKVIDYKIMIVIILMVIFLMVIFLMVIPYILAILL